MSARVSVLVPGLEGPAAGGSAGVEEAARALLSGLAVPGFTELMRHAAVARAPDPGETLARMGARLLGAAPVTDPVFPAAALSRAAFAEQVDLDARSRLWLRADPVHLRADMGKLVVFPADVLSLSLDQSSRILEWLMAEELFPGPALELLTATCWVCELEEPADMVTVSPREAYGSNATPAILGGKAASWHARMNEIQMLLHQCPVNDERERDGLAPINSLWYWGEGALPAAPGAGAGFDSVHADDPVVIGAARVAGVPSRRVAGSGDGWCRALDAGHHLLALDDLELPARALDPDSWREALRELDARWLQPLAEGLQSSSLSEVNLHVAGGMVRARRGRFWQRLRRSPDAADSLVRLRQGVAR